MEIVIKIDDERYKDIKRIAEVQFESNYFKTAEQIIANGTPLPKGHGRLIDANKLKTHIVGTEQGTDLEVYLKPTVINAPIIIEADKESEVEK